MAGLGNVVGDISMIIVVSVFWLIGAWLLNLVDSTWPSVLPLETDNKRMLMTLVFTVIAISLVSMLTKRGILGWCGVVAGLFGNYTCAAI